MFEILGGTPWWVYLLFFLLVGIGFKARKPQVMSLKKVFILPLAFTAWSLYSVFTSSNVFFYIFIWLPFLVAGGVFGWFLYRNIKIRADRKKQLIEIPGSWGTLALILIIFATKYTFGYLYSEYPHTRKDVFVYGLDMITSGAITGMFAGRALLFVRKFLRSPQVDLVEK